MFWCAQWEPSLLGSNLSCRAIPWCPQWGQSFLNIHTPVHSLQGNALVCPVGTISVIRKPTDGRLDGMQCYSTTTSMEISNTTPLKNVSDLLVVTEAGELGLMSTPGVLRVCLTVTMSVRSLSRHRGLATWLHWSCDNAMTPLVALCLLSLI